MFIIVHMSQSKPSSYPRCRYRAEATSDSKQTRGLPVCGYPFSEEVKPRHQSVLVDPMTGFPLCDAKPAEERPCQTNTFVQEEELRIHIFDRFERK